MVSTLQELARYCNEEKHLGALLLTGEWGCGKTYLIDNDLAEALRDTHFTGASNNPHGRARNMRTSFWKTNS